MALEWDLPPKSTEVAGPSPAEMRLRWSLYRETLSQARALEGLAEQYRLEAEGAYADVATMKAEGRRRPAVQNPRMLPSHERAVDVKTNTMKAMADAKGDVAFYLSMANTYANLAAMKYTKAAAIKPGT